MPTAAGLPLEHQTFLTQQPRDVLRILKSSEEGLSVSAAAERHLHDGANLLPRHEETWIAILARQFFSPLVGLLVTAGTISFILGETTDGITVVGILILNGALGFVQEFRSSKSVAALERYLRSSATVRRGGAISTIDRSALVKGDIVILRAGDAVPADIRLLKTENLQVDESTLTGESVDVTKQATPLERPTSNLHETTNVVFSGSWVRRGAGEGIVIATGAHSVVGSIAELVSVTKHDSTFEKNVRQFSSFLVKVVAVSLTIVLAVDFMTKSSSVNFSQQLLFAMALAISVIPEALPAVTTITFSRGALLLAKQHVVVKRLSAIEDLGHIDVLCTDKTGTLTENKPAVSSFLATDKNGLLLALLSAIPPTVRAGGREAGDPFHEAILTYAQHEGLRIPGNDVIDEIPFDAERRRSGTLIRDANTLSYVVMGAPEVILELCNDGLDQNNRSTLDEKISKLGQAGERTIAVAKIIVPSESVPKDLRELEHNLTFLGVISFFDPIKPTSHKAILDAEQLGIEVKIVTGDSAAVAGDVAKKLGLIKSITEVLTSEQLERLSPAEYDRAVRDTNVFARMTPIQKFKLIESLERQKVSVGFLGEGINDAPALKLATVSLVVDEASDVAREAADIVLLDKSLHVIVDGIKQGRVIYGNVLKYIKYTLVGNFGNFFAIAGISLIVNFLPMLPVQILLTNILTDFPLVAVASDNVDEKEVRRPQHFRLRELGFLTMTLGLVSSLFDFIFFGAFHTAQPVTIQTMWFIESILSELLLIYSIRTSLPIQQSKNASSMLIWLTALSALAAVVLPLTSFGQTVFHFEMPTAHNLILVAAIVILYFVVTEIVKRLYYRSYRLHEA